MYRSFVPTSTPTVVTIPTGVHRVSFEMWSPGGSAYSEEVTVDGYVGTRHFAGAGGRYRRCVALVDPLDRLEIRGGASTGVVTVSLLDFVGVDPATGQPRYDSRTTYVVDVGAQFFDFNSDCTDVGPTEQPSGSVSCFYGFCDDDDPPAEPGRSFPGSWGHDAHGAVPYDDGTSVQIRPADPGLVVVEY